MTYPTLPQDSILRRHYESDLKIRQGIALGMQASSSMPPQDSVLRRHHESAIAMQIATPSRPASKQATSQTTGIGQPNEPTAPLPPTQSPNISSVKRSKFRTWLRGLFG